VTYRNADTIHAEVAQTENAGTVSDDADLGIRVGPIPENRPNGPPLLNRNVQSLRARVQRRVLEADVADGGGVHQGHQLLGIVDEQAVEQVDVLCLEVRQVQVLVDVCLARADHLQGALALTIGVLHDMGDEARQVLGDALLGSEGQALRRGTKVSSKRLEAGNRS
jgi:hypothetical protein